MFLPTADLVVSTSADLGTPLLIAPPPIRSHLVPPQPQPRTVQEDLTAQVRSLERQIWVLEARVTGLEARVAYLEAPGWWQRQWEAVVTWTRATWARVWKE